MTLLADLSEGRPRVVLAPIGALRQYMMPRALFDELRFALRSGDEPGWDQMQQRLHRLGYTRADVVSAAGEYAVRGGIVDVFAATAPSAVRVEFFGDAIESMRFFELESQRSTVEIDSLEIAPWSEIPRDAGVRERVLRRFDGPQPVRDALAAYIETGNDVPESWLPLAYDERTTLFEYLDHNAIVVLDEPTTVAAVATALDEERSREAHVLLADVDSGQLQVDESSVGDALLAEIASPHPSLDEIGERIARHASLRLPGGIETPNAIGWAPSLIDSFVFECRPVEHFNRQIEMFSQSVREWTAGGETTLIVSFRRRRAPATFSARPASRATWFASTRFHRSRLLAARLRLRVLGDREIFGAPPKRVKMRAVKEGVPVTLADLRVGDFVVHAVHGIGQYLGLRTETILGRSRLPRPAVRRQRPDAGAGTPDASGQQVRRARRAAPATLQDGRRRLGAHERPRFGSAREDRRRPRRVVCGARELARGLCVRPDTPWQREIEEAFPYEPTPDQAKAIDETKADMERPRPMDRLVCGDVGYGKTEVAMRAAFKAIADKKQVAILVPTTLLASQHHRTFSQRFASFPVRIEELSRFKTKKEQQATLAASGRRARSTSSSARTGCLQKDVVFRDLGLIIVDEEQRFGVMHKERLKQMRATRRRADALGHADSAHAADVADGRARSLADPDRAAQPHVDQDGRRARRRTRSCSARSPPSSIAAARCTTCTTASNRSTAWRARSRNSSRTRASRVGHGQMHEHELEPIMSQVHRRRDRRVRLDDDHRERHRHPQRQHDHRQRRRQVRARTTLSTARTRRALEPSGLRVSALSGAQGADAKMPRRGWKRSASSPTSVRVCRSRCAISRFAARGTCSAPRSRASSPRSASRRTRSCWPRRSPRARARKPLSRVRARR